MFPTKPNVASPHVSVLDLKEDTICNFAEVLRNSNNEVYEKSQVCLYIAGKLDTKKVGMMMYHNITYHQCQLNEQMIQLNKLIDAWKLLGKRYEKQYFINEVIDVMCQLIVLAKQYWPRPTLPVCTWQTSGSDWTQLENINAFLTFDGVYTFAQQTNNFDMSETGGGKNN